MASTISKNIPRTPPRLPVLNPASSIWDLEMWCKMANRLYEDGWGRLDAYITAAGSEDTYYSADLRRLRELELNNTKALDFLDHNTMRPIYPIIPTLDSIAQSTLERDRDILQRRIQFYEEEYKRSNTYYWEDNSKNKRIIIPTPNLANQNPSLSETGMAFPPESSDGSQSSSGVTSIYAQDVLDLEGVKNLTKFYDYPITPVLDYGFNYSAYVPEESASPTTPIPSRAFDTIYRYQDPINDSYSTGINNNLFAGVPVPDYYEPPAAYQYPNDNIDGWDIANFTHPDIDAGAAAHAGDYAAIQSDWDAINQNYEANRPLTWKEGINTAGSAINTAYNVMSFGSTLQDVLTGRRSDPGAYLSLANSAAQGLSWLSKTDGAKEIVSAIGDLQGPLDKLGNVTGGAVAGWGLYQNIAGLANGEVNAQNVLGAVANSSALINSVGKLAGLTDQIPGSVNILGNAAGGALSAIGLVQGVQGLLEGEAQSPMDILGLAKNAYGTYSAVSSLMAEGGAASASASSLAAAGPASMMGLVAAPLAAVMVAGPLLASLTRDYMTPQDAQELIAAQGEFLGGSVYAPQGSLSEAILEGSGAPPRLRQDQADSINLMETLAGRAGYSQETVHGMVVDQMGYLAPGAIAAANRMEALDTVFNPMEMGRLANPDEWFARDEAMRGMQDLGVSLGATPDEMMAGPGGFALPGDQDQLQMMLDKLKELASVMVEADSGLASLVGNFQGLGQNLGLSQEAIPAFNEQMLTLSAQLLQGQIGVDGFSAGVQAIASGLGLSSEQGLALVQTVLAMIAPLGQGGQAAGLLGGGAGGAADALGRAVDAGQGLIGAANGLGGALTAGATQAAAAGVAIDAGLGPAIAAAAHQAEVATQEAGALAGAIQSIPTSWQSNLYFTRYYQTVGEPFHSGGFVFHQGGLVLHAGGLAEAPRLHEGGWFNELLKPFEVPAILQRGEYVVRQQSVTPQTLPWLRRVNQSGALPGEGGGTQVHINAPLVQVQGGLTSDPEAIEGLARLVEAKLMDLQDGRFGGEAAYL